jgi:hypothetical protein
VRTKFSKLLAAQTPQKIQLIRTIGVRIVWIRVWNPPPDGKSEVDENRIRSKKAVTGKEAAINEETIVREEVTVKIIEAAVENLPLAKPGR